MLTNAAISIHLMQIIYSIFIDSVSKDPRIHLRLISFWFVQISKKSIQIRYEPGNTEFWVYV